MRGIRSKRIFLIVLFAFNINMLAAQGYTVTQIKDIKAIFNLTFELDQVKEYLHFDSLPERLPIKFKEFGKINTDSMDGFMLFDSTVQFHSKQTLDSLTINDYFNIGDWTHVKDHLRVQLYYLVEGITINLMFHKIEGNWIIDNHLITEE